MMKKLPQIILLITLVIVFSSCSVSKQVVGEFYLEGKKFDKGSQYFQKKIEENENSATSQYYYGRFLLAKKKPNLALIHLKKAVFLDDKNAIYHSWLGVAYSLLKQNKNEKESYKKALKIDKNNLQSLTYLAHNYYDSKEYKKALSLYSKILKLNEYHQTALYNRALCLKQLKRVPEEKMAWKEYLLYYPSGSLARNAVIYLNMLGVFEYQNHIIGDKIITLKKIKFKPFSIKLTFDSSISLDVLGEVLLKNKKVKIYIISYQQNNVLLAKQKAKGVKNYILEKYQEIETDRLILSWFDKSKIKLIHKKIYSLGENIDFVTIVKK